MLGSFARSLNAQVVGSGTEYLVLAHGFGCNQSVWRDYVPWLAERYRVVLYDLACAATAADSAFDIRRHGTLEGYADDLIRLLTELKIDRCIYIGHSVSGMAGLLAALQEPVIFDRLLLLGASARYLDDEDYDGGFDHEGVLAITDAIGADYKKWATDFAPFAMSRELADPATQSFLDTLRRMRPDIAVATLRAIMFSDFRDKLDQCDTPTIIMQCLKDPAVPMGAAKYLRSHLKNSVLEILDAEGHLPHLAAPDQVMTAFRRNLPLFSEA